jgi:hypothetical protein
MMLPSQITQILLRLFALSWFVGGIAQVIGGIAFHCSPVGSLNSQAFVVLLPGFLLAVIAALLWAFAPFVADRITRGNNQEVALPGLSYLQLLTAMFVGLGLYFCLSSFGDIYNLLSYFVLSRMNLDAVPKGLPDSYPRLISQSLTFAAGLFVIFSARSWAVKLAKK